MGKTRIFEKFFKLYIILTFFIVYFFIDRRIIINYLPTLIFFYIFSITLIFLKIDLNSLLFTLPLSFFIVSFFFRTHLYPEILISGFNRFFLVFLYFFKKVNIKIKIPERIKVVSINFTLFIFLSEILLNMFYIFKPLDILKRKDEILKLYGYSYFNGERVNRYGFLGREFDSLKKTQRILFIGDSFGVGVVDYRFNFIRMVEDSLNFEVVNLSQPGLSPKDYYNLLETYFDKTDPDITCIIIFSGNDVTEVFYPENNYSFFNLKITSLVRNIFLLFKSNQNGDFSEKDFYLIEKRRATILKRDSFKREWKIFEKNMETIIDFLKERDVKFFFIIIPDQFSVDKKVQEKIVSYGFKPDYGWDFVDRRIEDILKEKKVSFFSLLDTFKICYIDGFRLYKDNNTHLNEKGNYTIFKYLEKFLKENRDKNF